jgi:hypothetical protein
MWDTTSDLSERTIIIERGTMVPGMTCVLHVAQQGLQVASRQVLLQGYERLLAWLQGSQ